MPLSPPPPRRPHLLLVLLLLASSGGIACEDPGPDYIEMEGVLADNQPFSFSQQLVRMTCDSTERGARCVNLGALQQEGATNDALRGVRVTYVVAGTQTGVGYDSGLLSPVTVYVVRAQDRRFTDSRASGGALTFTSIATRAGEVTAGTFGGHDVALPDAAALAARAPVRITRGSFRYVQQ